MSCTHRGAEFCFNDHQTKERQLRCWICGIVLRSVTFEQLQAMFGKVLM